MPTITQYLESLPTADVIREQLARNEQERKLLQKLLRIADEQERLPVRDGATQEHEVAYAS